MLCAVDLVLDDDRELVRFVAYEDVEVAPLALHLCVSEIPHIQVDRGNRGVAGARRAERLLQ